MFDWMTAHVPPHVVARGTTARQRMHAEEIRGRASLLKRLGYPEAYALHRCLSNLEDAFALHGTSPLTHEEVRKLVADVYQR